ncbi:MAG: hypothetical protein IJN86_04415 [Clostridia bacterium]|nr:hypothetical protein [Clostridia bacterium]MBQ7048173.1 hypothetical protein [Clostridia bacterium]
MYIVPYVLIAIVFFGGFVICLRTRAASERNSMQGVFARAALSLLILCILWMIWKYVSVETFNAKQWDDDKLVFWVRFISALLGMGGIFEVWTDHKTGEL